MSHTIQLPLFPSTAFLPAPHLAREHDALVAHIAEAIGRFGRLEAMVHHVAQALIAHQRRLADPGAEWPEGLKFTLGRGLPPIVVPSLLPVRDILGSMEHGIAAPLVQRARILFKEAWGRERGDVLGWPFYAVSCEDQVTPFRRQVLMPDFIPIFDDLWLKVLQARDRHIGALTQMKSERLQAIDGLTREDAERNVARWDARLIALETLLPPQVTASRYECYLRLAHDLPEPRFGSYGFASGILL
jgi:hypothetical protein